MMQLPKKERERILNLGYHPDCARLRNLTYDGIAQAMADQWG